MELWNCLPGESDTDTVSTHMVKSLLNRDGVFRKKPDKSYIISERYKATVCLGPKYKLEIALLEVSGQNDLSYGYFRKVGRKTEYVLSEEYAHLIGIRKALAEGKSVPERVRDYYTQHKHSIGE